MENGGRMKFIEKIRKTSIVQNILFGVLDKDQITTLTSGINSSFTKDFYMLDTDYIPIRIIAAFKTHISYHPGSPIIHLSFNNKLISRGLEMKYICKNKLNGNEPCFSHF